jgi:pyruvate dehydrogenase E1 component
MRAVPDQVARWVPRPFFPLGTDGFGMSDARGPLRSHFEIDAAHIVVAVLDGLRRQGEIGDQEVRSAIDGFGLDPEASAPFAL